MEKKFGKLSLNLSTMLEERKVAKNASTAKLMAVGAEVEASTPYPVSEVHGIFERKDCIDKTNAYAITIFNGNTTIKKFVDLAAGETLDEIEVPEGTYSVIVGAGIKDESEAKLSTVTGLGVVDNVAVTDGNLALTDITVGILYTYIYVDYNGMTKDFDFMFVHVYAMPNLKFKGTGPNTIKSSMTFDVSSGFPIPSVTAHVIPDLGDQVGDMATYIYMGGTLTIPSNAVGEVEFKMLFDDNSQMVYVDPATSKEFNLMDLAHAPGDAGIYDLSKIGIVAKFKATQKPAVGLNLSWMEM